VGGPDPGLTGPIGIAQITGEVAEAGISPFFELVAIISISLGLINILPIPALDGGRLMFVLIEWARRGRRISPHREGLVHVIGFAILIGLIVVVSFFDISRILSGDSIIR
jgi:regulator of sigma E protease